MLDKFVPNWLMGLILGCEIEMKIQAEDFDLAWGEHMLYDSNGSMMVPICGIETIGCETHLVVAHDGRIQLYEAMPKIELERLKRLLKNGKRTMQALMRQKIL